MRGGDLERSCTGWIPRVEDHGKGKGGGMIRGEDRGNWEWIRGRGGSRWGSRGGRRYGRWDENEKGWSGRKLSVGKKHIVV